MYLNSNECRNLWNSKNGGTYKEAWKRITGKEFDSVDDVLWKVDLEDEMYYFCKNGLAIYTSAHEMDSIFVPMTLDHYQHLAAKFAMHPTEPHSMGLAYVALGLAGEAGEYADKVKKVLRGDHAADDAPKCAERQKELGDVLWYLARAAGLEKCGSLGGLAIQNLMKLEDRQKRGTIQGSGDNR